MEKRNRKKPFKHNLRIKMKINASVEDLSVQNNSFNKATSETFRLISYIYVALAVLLAVVVIIGNLLLILSYKFNRLLRSGTYTILVSLAISDTIVGGVSLPLWIYGDLQNWTEMHPIVRDIFLSFDVFSAVASILHLTSVSIERYIAISKPYYYNTLSKKIYHKGIAGIWIVSFALASLEPVQRRVGNWMFYYTAMILIACFAVPLVIMCFVYSYIFIVTRRILRSSNGAGRDSKRRSIKKEIRAAGTLVIITGLFAIAWFPFFALTAMALFCPKTCLPQTGTLLFLVSFVKWMHYSNSACNPFVYAYRDSLVKQTFRRLLTAFCNLFRGQKLLKLPAEPVATRLTVSATRNSAELLDVPA